MVRNAHDVVNYVPLYIHRFRFLQPHFMSDAEKFNIAYTDPSRYTTVADKLRYYRYKNGLLQRDVADHANIERTTYTAYEDGTRDYYPLDILARIANLLKVDIADLLDEYHAFLYRGQASQVRSLRKQLGLTQESFAIRFGVATAQVRRWEQDAMRMTKKMWLKVFKG